MTQPNTAQKAKSGRAKLIVALVLLALVLILIFQNTASGRINVLFWHVTLPTWVWLLVILVVGVVIGSMFPWFRPKKKKAARN